MDEGFVATNGIRLHYLDHGGDGPPVLMLPGLTANAHSFDGLVAGGLAGALRVIALDLRGRGMSDKPDTGYAQSDHAADVLGVMDALGFDTVRLVGHSFGGLLTYFLCAHYGERIAAAAAIDAPPETHRGLLDQIKPSLDRLEVVFPSMEAYMETVRAMPYFGGEWNDQLEAWYAGDVEVVDGGVRARSRPGHILEAAEGTLDVDWPTLVTTIETPVLFIRATEDLVPGVMGPLVPADQGDRAVGWLPNGTLVEVPGNHITCVFGDNAAPLATRIGEFLAV
jgi:pimeloyl-ACP methyl ester carboxylesterase